MAVQLKSSKPFIALMTKQWSKSYKQPIQASWSNPLSTALSHHLICFCFLTTPAPLQWHQLINWWGEGWSLFVMVVVVWFYYVYECAFFLIFSPCCRAQWEKERLLTTENRLLMAVSLIGQLRSFGIFTSSSESLLTFTCIWARGNFHKGRVRYIHILHILYVIFSLFCFDCSTIMK